MSMSEGLNETPSYVSDTKLRFSLKVIYSWTDHQKEETFYELLKFTLAAHFKLRLASTAVTLLTRILEVHTSNLLRGTGFHTEVSRSFI